MKQNFLALVPSGYRGLFLSRLFVREPGGGVEQVSGAGALSAARVNSTASRSSIS